MKVSVHSEGARPLRVAFTKESGLAASDDPTGDRVIADWDQPTEFRPGWTQYFDVNVPTTPYLDRLRVRGSEDRGATWIPPAPPEHGWQVTLLQAAPHVEHQEDVLRAMGAEHWFGPLRLGNGRSVWVVSKQYVMDENERNYLATRDVAVHLRPGATPDKMSASVVEIHGDTHPVILNYVLARSHFVQA